MTHLCRSSSSPPPQPATAPAARVGAPRCPSAPSVQLDSCSTRASVWRPVGRGCTRRTTPATVRTSFQTLHTDMQSCSPLTFDLLLPCFSDCHPSCRSCVGPLASDCLRCLKPEETLLPQSGHLQHGVCTAGCPAHTYLDDVRTCRGEHMWIGLFVRLAQKRLN